MHILVTGATGKVGSHFIRRILNADELSSIHIRALCHNRLPILIHDWMSLPAIFLTAK